MKTLQILSNADINNVMSNSKQILMNLSLWHQSFIETDFLFLYFHLFNSGQWTTNITKQCPARKSKNVSLSSKKNKQQSSIATVFWIVICSLFISYFFWIFTIFSFLFSFLFLSILCNFDSRQNEECITYTRLSDSPTEVNKGHGQPTAHPASHHWSGRWPPVLALLWCRHQFFHTYNLHSPGNLLVSPTF